MAIAALAATVIVLCVASLPALAEALFPPPQFETAYKLPTQYQTPPSRGWYMAYVDVAVLVGALSLAAWFAYGDRSRRRMLWLTVFSLAYFGFYREGCVCPIGAIQNVTVALLRPGFALPLTVGLFFLLPLAVSLFFGRAFCAGVCPLGAAQELVLLRPVKTPAFVDHALGLIPFVFLGAGVIFAATGSQYLICRYDPFVGFFRFTGDLSMLLTGAALLVIGVFLGRPYCRFFCPYGALLRLLSRFAQWQVRISPKECVDCRLCETSCPYGAIQTPSPGVASRDLPRARRRLVLMLALLPVFVALGAGLGALAGPAFSRLHPTVALARQVAREEAGRTKTMTEESKVFRQSGKPVAELFDQADAVARRFVWVSAGLGAWVGLVVGGKLVSLSLRKRRSIYEPDPGLCVACGRCFLNCPKEHERLRGGAPIAGALLTTGQTR